MIRYLESSAFKFEREKRAVPHRNHKIWKVDEQVIIPSANKVNMPDSAHGCV